MEIKYEIVATDITKYSKEAAAGTTSLHIQVVILCSIVTLFMLSDMILAALSTIRNDGSINVVSYNMLARLLISFAIMGISYLAVITLGRIAARRIETTTTGKNGLFCEHTITLDDSGFTETTDVNKTFHSWEGVEKITETDSYVTIHIRLGAGYFIPKHAFSTENQIKTFVSTVTTHIEAASIPSPPTFPN